MTQRIDRIRGLTEQDVHASRQQHGDNALTRITKHSFLRDFLMNFGDPIIKILLVALVANIVLRLRDFNWYETVGIAAAILVSTFVSTLSEYGSEKAFDKLQADALKTTCRVKRAHGLAEVAVTDIVVGDMVLLQAGERIPADGVIISGEIYVDQSPLNGESKEAHKSPGTSPSGASDDGFSDRGRLFRGCVVCSGEAVMRVLAVGGSTFYGRLARDVQEESRESPLKMRLGKLAQTISRFGYIGAALVALADLFNAIVIANGFNGMAIMSCLQTPQLILGHLIHAATLSISVIVVAIPEGLPLMITIVLSSNMKRMLRDHVLVRKLVGIETSGNLSILFTDKTGTITKGKLKAQSFVSGDGTVYRDFRKIAATPLGALLRVSCLYNTSAAFSKKNGQQRAIGGNATERALLEFVAERQPAPARIRVVSSVPFSSLRKFSSARVDGDVRGLLVKGAPELILPLCTGWYDEGGVRRALTNPAKLKKALGDMTASAARVLAVAVGESAATETLGGELTLVGLFAIRDEVRREAPRAIRQVTQAGVQVVMITGDNDKTAAAVAREAGMLKNSDDARAVLTSKQLANMTDGELRKVLPHLRVVARAVPSDKTRLIAAAQHLGLVAGMTGDGINDAPALKKADVGFSMGSGTEVAKEAGDIVVLDDNFLSIAKAILYGRTIFKSIRKFIIFQLTINLCAVAVSIIGPFVGISSPITVLQMLWVNMVMDTLAGLAFAGEAPLAEYMHEPPKKPDEPIINRYMYNQIIVGGMYMTVLCLLFLKLPAIHSMYRHGGGDEFFMTAFFAMFIFAGVFTSFNARTTRLNLLAYVWRNKGFIAIMLFVSLIQVMIIYFGGAIFRTTGLSYMELQFVVILALSVIPVDFIRKSAIGSLKRGGAL